MDGTWTTVVDLATLVENETYWLYGLHALAENDIWVCGQVIESYVGGSLRGWVYHYDGVDWSEAYRTTEPATVFGDICAISSSDVYVCGMRIDYGFIKHYDGGSWHSETFTATPDGMLTGIYIGTAYGCVVGDGDGTDPSIHESDLLSSWDVITGTDGIPFNDVDGIQWLDEAEVLQVMAWAVGDGGVIWYRDETGWSAQESGTTENLNAVCAIDGGYALAAGDNGTFLMYTGGVWLDYAAMTFTEEQLVIIAEQNFLSIALDLVAGVIFITTEGSVWRFNGAWEMEDTDVEVGPYMSVTGVSPYDDGFITVNSNTFEDLYSYICSFTETVYYTITASAGTGGTITPDGDTIVESGSDQSFVIAASIGYSIGDVLVDGESVGAVASYEFIAVGANHTIAASFIADPVLNPEKWERFILGDLTSNKVRLRLQPDTEYAFAIRGVNAGENFGEWSDIFEYTTLSSGDPTAPSTLALSAINDSLVVSWTRSIDKDVIAYNVYISTSTINVGIDNKVIGLSPTYIVDSNTIHIPNLEYGTTYYVRLESVGKNTSRSVATSEEHQALPNHCTIVDDLTVDGTATVDGFTMALGAVNDYVLISDENGIAHWGVVSASGGSIVAALDDLTDVELTSPVSGESLVYDGVNWVNSDIENLTDHNLLNNLQGGAVDEYYHLSSGSYTGLVGLSSGRVPYVASGGYLIDSSTFTYDGSYLTVPSLKDSALTAGRVVYVGASDELTDNANLTYDGTKLSSVDMSYSRLMTTPLTDHGIVTVGGANIITDENASFEGGTVGIYTTLALCTVAVVAGGFHGTKELQSTTTEAGTASVRGTITAVVAVGAQYTLSVWLKAGNEAAVGKDVRACLKGNISGTTYGSLVTLTTEWQRSTVTKTFGATDTLIQAVPIYAALSEVGDIIAVDAIQLEAGSTASDFGISTTLNNTSQFTYDGNSLSVLPDTDTVHTFGRAKIGYDGSSSDYAAFAHYDCMTSAARGFMQKYDGQTMINAPDTSYITLRIGALEKWRITGTAGDLLAYGATRTISAAAGYDLNIKMGDAVGANSIIFQSSTPATVASMNSYGDLGLGAVANPTYRLYVTKNYSPTSDEDPKVIYASSILATGASATGSTLRGVYTYIRANSANNCNTIMGADYDVRNIGAGTVGYAYGFRGIVQNTGSGGNITNAYGMRGIVTCASAGNMTNAFAGNFNLNISSTGNITSGYGLYVDVTDTGAGGYTNLYGLYITTGIAGAATLNYAIYNASISPIATAGDIQFLSAAHKIAAAATFDLTIKLGDAAGAKSLLITDSGDVTVASINSDGNATFTSLALAKATKTTTYTITEDDHAIICNHAVTPFTVTLPAATGSGRIYRIKNIGAANVTLEGNASETIDSALNQTLVQWDGVAVVDYDTGVWVII